MDSLLEKTKIISEVAKLLYSFLPGNPHPFADASLSFRGIAYELGLGQFWQAGSKLPAITNLLEKALEKGQFCPLIIRVVHYGIKYRANRGDDVTRNEIRDLNELLLKLGFKVPELWERSFLESLPSAEEETPEKKELDRNKLVELKDKLVGLSKLPPQKRGYAFQDFLQGLFSLFDLKPKSPFRLIGEEIDGSIELGNHTYLIEAKWQNAPVGQKDLLVFRGKVESKATWSRGLFISYSGFTKDGLEAFSRGRSTNLIAMSGEDLFFILHGKIGLDKVISLKSRYAAETGGIMIRVYDLRNMYPRELED